MGSDFCAKLGQPDDIALKMSLLRNALVHRPSIVREGGYIDLSLPQRPAGSRKVASRLSRIVADGREQASECHTIAPPVRGKVWVLPGYGALHRPRHAACAVSQDPAAGDRNQASQRALPALRAAYRIMKQQNVELEKELADYKVRVEKLARNRRGGRTAPRLPADVRRDQNDWRDQFPCTGRGSLFMLQDSPKRNPSETRQDVVNDYIVHDRDIREIVNELFAAGAEAISVNGQRLVASSSIRCVGPVVLVNSTQVAPPFMIKAIGKSGNTGERPEAADGGC